MPSFDFIDLRFLPAGNGGNLVLTRFTPRFNRPRILLVSCSATCWGYSNLP